jgi:hypothetical protein
VHTAKVRSQEYPVEAATEMVVKVMASMFQKKLESMRTKNLTKRLVSMLEKSSANMLGQILGKKLPICVETVQKAIQSRGGMPAFSKHMIFQAPENGNEPNHS